MLFHPVAAKQLILKTNHLQGEVSLILNRLLAAVEQVHVHPAFFGYDISLVGSLLGVVP